MGLLNKFLEYFRKKEYYVIDYEALNNYSVTFKEVTDEDLNKIKEIIISVNESESLDDNNIKIFEYNATKFLSINDLMVIIRETILEDFRKTYFEAISNDWDFHYFVTNYAAIYKDLIVICIKISSKKNVTQGDVMYPLLAVKKFNNDYYFWSFLEKYDNLSD